MLIPVTMSPGFTIVSSPWRCIEQFVLADAAGANGMMRVPVFPVTLAREAERSELRARFADEAARSEEQALSSGKAFELAATFDYLAARASGVKARRPKARAWRRSK
jgi:hypothetical protein